MSPSPSHTSQPQPSSASRRIALALAALVCVATALAVVPHLLGYGCFGHRAIIYGQGDLYVLNLEETPRFVAVDGERPLHVEAGNARIIPVVGGDFSVEAFDDEHQLINGWELEANDSDLFMNFSDDRCFVVSRLSGVDDPDNITVEITDRLDAGTEFTELESRNVVWPRGVPGVGDEGSSEPAKSLEIVDCSLLYDSPFLGDYLETQFQDRLR